MLFFALHYWLWLRIKAGQRGKPNILWKRFFSSLFLGNRSQIVNEWLVDGKWICEWMSATGSEDSLVLSSYQLVYSKATSYILLRNPPCICIPPRLRMRTIDIFDLTQSLWSFSSYWPQNTKCNKSLRSHLFRTFAPAQLWKKSKAEKKINNLSAGGRGRVEMEEERGINCLNGMKNKRGGKT